MSLDWLFILCLQHQQHIIIPARITSACLHPCNITHVPVSLISWSHPRLIITPRWFASRVHAWASAKRWPGDLTYEPLNCSRDCPPPQLEHRRAWVWGPGVRTKGRGKKSEYQGNGGLTAGDANVWGEGRLDLVRWIESLAAATERVIGAAVVCVWVFVCWRAWCCSVRTLLEGCNEGFVQ